MAIKKENYSVDGIYWRGHSVLSVYTNGYLVWPEDIPIEDVLSCYFNSYWIDEYPWTDDTPWTD